MDCPSGKGIRPGMGKRKTDTRIPGDALQRKGRKSRNEKRHKKNSGKIFTLRRKITASVEFK